jgi:pantoate--beta-alanine ligase
VALVVLKTRADLINWRLNIAPKKRVGFVPTMGALHLGHATLLRQARLENDFVVLSIFVNPTQFGVNEDLDRYPRALAEDLRIAESEKVDVVFAPDVSEMYPTGHSTFVEETEFSKGLCGDFRPGHFRGVATVVLKLFNLVRPGRSYFGLKDAQQFLVISKMVLDLNLDIKMIGVPTVREADGLAMSSRNRGLSKEDREKAPEIYRSLLRVTQGSSSIAQEIDVLSKLDFKVQYYERRPFESGHLVAIAAYLGSTRLIDNILG